MRIQQTRKISDDFYVVGNAQVPVYLLGGPRPVLFDAGFNALSTSYEKDIKKIFNKRAPAYLLNTHARVKRVWERMQSDREAANAF